MRYSIEIINEDEAKSWNKFISDYGCVFHLFEWSQILSETYGYNPVYFALLNKDEDINSVFPTVITPSKKMVSLPFLDYVNIISKKVELSKTMLDYVLKYCKFLGIVNFENYTTNLIRNKHLKFFHSSNTYVLNTALDFKKIWMDYFSKKRRNLVRKALKNDLVVKQEKNKSFLYEYYKIYLKTMKRLGQIPQSSRLFFNILKYLGKFVEMYSVRLEGNLIAGLIVLKFNNYFNIWNNASISKYWSYAPNDLLYYEVIKNACNMGIKRVDFGSTPLVSGLEHFKKSFGGIPVPIYKLTNISSTSILQNASKYASHILSFIVPMRLHDNLGNLIYSKIY